MSQMDTWLRYLSPQRKMIERVGKIKATWERMKQITLRRIWIDLADVEMNWSTWRETCRLEKGLTRQSRLSWRIGIHIEVWKHRLGKVWNQHLTLKQLEYHNSKQKQRTGLQNKPEQTYDRDFVRSFRGGAYTGSIIQHHHLQGSAHDIRSVPESA